MLDKIKALLSSAAAKAEPMAAKALALAPLPMGIAIGYLGHGLIKMAIDAALAMAKLILKI